jgi:hypothetical protein
VPWAGTVPVFLRGNTHRSSKTFTKINHSTAKSAPIIPKKKKEYNHVFDYVKNLQESPKNRSHIVYNHKSTSGYFGMEPNGYGKNQQNTQMTMRPVLKNNATGCS